MKKILQCSLLLLNLLAATALFARKDNNIITGTALSKGTAVPNVSVALLKSTDSSVVKLSVTDAKGKYLFENIANGSYLLNITGVGFESWWSATFDAQGKTIDLGTVELIAKTKNLGAVTVTARKPLIEMKADKMVVNVDASPTNAGNSALEVLEKSPGVIVDKDGNISLKGKQGVMVLIDGRPSYVSGTDLANMLRGMNASQLDQIEIMTNPPAKYDAAGNSGIINIKTKKIKTKGANGTVNTSYGQGVYAKTNLGANLNYRNNKFNLFASVNHSYRGGYQQFSVDRKVFKENSKDIAFTFDQAAYMPDTRNTYTSKLGIDYDFSKRTSASVSFNLFNTKMTYDNNITNKISDANGNLQTINIGRTYMTPNVRNNSGNINVVHKFDSAGTELNFNADYIDYLDKHKQKFYNSFYNASGTLQGKPDTLMGNLPNGFKVYAAKLDFTRPLKDDAKFEAGAKASYVTSDNDIRFDSIINDKIVLDVTRTNHYQYKEKIFAGYVNYSTPLSKKLSMQAGLRYEYTLGNGNSITSQQKFKNEYGKLFPTLYFSYKANDNNSINLNYGRRISRPQYRSMNPFVFIIDRYTFQTGNPYLQPYFSHNIELSHSYKGFLTTTLNYSRITDAISEVVETNEQTKEASLIPRNIARQQQFGLAVNLYKPVNKWLTVITNANVWHNRFTGTVDNTEVDVEAFSGNFNAALQFKFGKGWDAEVNGFFSTKNVDGVSLNGSMGMFSVAASKAILQNKGKVTLNVRDPFAWQRYSGSTKFSTVDASIVNRWDNRVVNLSFSYKFGKMFKTKSRNTSSAAEEQSRIGG